MVSYVENPTDSTEQLLKVCSAMQCDFTKVVVYKNNL